MLVACGNSDNKLPQECNDVSDPLENYHRIDFEEFIRIFKKELKNDDYEKQKKL